MNILIIGSEGFIGSHCEQYFLKNHFVFSCDVIDNKKDNYLSLRNSSIQSILEKKEFNVCINCSGASNVADSYHYPLNDFELNTKNVSVFLESIRLFQPKCKFINLSSAAVYGNPSANPISEDTKVNPISNYGFHKSYSELICTQFHKVYGLRTTSIRIFSAYGSKLK